MKYDTSSNGYEIAFEAPNSVEEYDRQAGSGQCLKDAVAETANRSTILTWQAAFAKLLEERTGIRREVDADATAKAKERAKRPEKTSDVLERFSTYNKRVNDQYANGDDTKRSELEEWAQETAAKIPVDPTRQRGGGKISQGDLAKAADILSGTPESIEAKVNKYLDEVGDFDLARDDSGLPEKNSLARLVSRYVQAVL